MTSRILGWLKDALWVLVFAGLAAAAVRFGLGLGASTGLNDASPWGLWIAVKLCFVALAGGGFTLAAMVYIFRLESYRPIASRAILLALLGYGSFIVSLIFDLGLPTHIYMPVIHWQHHSVMFEIAWCVMLYFSVLVMEFTPAVLEHSMFQHPFFLTILGWLHRAVLPLVILGIVLSTLHQSSLGALFLIMPHRVHPLWYSPWIPPLFLISAVAAGLMAVIVEQYLAERLFGHKLDVMLLGRLSRLSAVALTIYLGLRVADLFGRGVLPAGLDGSWQSCLFIGEVLVAGVLPLALIAVKRIRQSREGLLTAALLVIAGVVSQRMSLSLFTMWRPPETPYRPSLLEVVIAVAIPAAAGLLYLFFTENLPVLSDHAAPAESPTPASPSGSASPQAAWTPGWRALLAHRSGLAVIAVALTLAVGPAYPAAGGAPAASPAQAAVGWDVLRIDANRSGYQVVFPHVEHQERLTVSLGQEQACQTCHHLNFPEDLGTACSSCHSDTVMPALIFNHTLHQQRLGGNAGCTECHPSEHGKNGVADCAACHETMAPEAGQTRFNPWAPPYPEALHTRCIGCHEQEAQAQSRPELKQCSTCHTSTGGDVVVQTETLAQDLKGSIK